MQTIEAIYQNGMFKPLNPVPEEISEGEKVEIILKDKKLSPDEMLKLAGQVYEGLSEEDINEIEKVALDRSNFLGGRTKELEKLLEGVNENNIHAEIDWGKPVGKEIIE